MKKVSFVLLILSFVVSFLSAQTDTSTLMTLGSVKVSKAEFERIYKKNNNTQIKTDNKSVQDYAQLFINFKLKVIEAEMMKLDTMPSFINELAGYRNQLAKPYLIDTTVENNLIKEAYDFMLIETRADHIYIKLDQNAAPADTLKAYNRIMEAREKLIKKEPFEKVAEEYSKDDPSFKKFKGHMGYLKPSDIPYYALEEALYKTKIGAISMPIRTQIGYHLIVVIDKRPAKGQIKVAHIMTLSPQGSNPAKFDSSKIKIFDVYEKIKNGEKFEDLAKKYSADPGSAAKGGELPPFSSGRMVQEFEDAAFALKNNGDVSEPIKTSFGWHIIKRLDYKPIPSFNEAKNNLKTKIGKDERATLGQQAVINRIKKQYGFKEFSDKIKPFYDIVDSSIYRNSWNSEKASDLNAVMFTLGKVNFTQKDFSNYLDASSFSGTKMPLISYVNKEYKSFADSKILDYEKDQLDKEYPDFRNIMQEYHDGILLFNLTDQKVWSKAVKDTAGLEKYYQIIKTKYMWKERMKATIVTSLNKKSADAALKIMSKDTDHQLTDSTIMAKACAKDTCRKCLTFTKGTYEKGDNKIIDNQSWDNGLSPVVNEDGKYIFVIKEIMAPEPKKLQEARGLITADYQNYLEENWIKELREKYPVVINQDLLNTVK